MSVLETSQLFMARTVAQPERIASSPTRRSSAVRPSLASQTTHDVFHALEVEVSAARWDALAVRGDTALDLQSHVGASVACVAGATLLVLPNASYVKEVLVNTTFPLSVVEIDTGIEHHNRNAASVDAAEARIGAELIEANERNVSLRRDADVAVCERKWVKVA